MGVIRRDTDDIGKTLCFTFLYFDFFFVPFLLKKKKKVDFRKVVSVDE